MALTRPEGKGWTNASQTYNIGKTRPQRACAGMSTRLSTGQTVIYGLPTSVLLQLHAHSSAVSPAWSIMLWQQDFGEIPQESKILR
eukprot:g23403.t1